MVGSVRSRSDLDRLELPELDRLCRSLHVDRQTVIAVGIAGIEDPDYRRFFETLLPLPFGTEQRWPPLGRKYISEEDAGRGVRAGFRAFGVTTWDGLNAPLLELDGESRRGVAERMLAEAIIAGERGRSRRGRLAVIAAVVLMALVGATVALVVLASADDDNVAAGTSSGAAMETPGSGAPSTTVSLPESELAGIQPEVTPTDGEDMSAAIESALSDEHLVFLAVPEGEPEEFAYYGRAIATLPSLFRYQAFNANADDDADPDMPSCRGMMSRELEVVGIWERQIAWDDGLLLVAVGRMATPAMAHELATAISVAAGVDPSECRGMDVYNIADYADYGVIHRDDPLLFDATDFNHWSEQDVQMQAGLFAGSHRIVAEEGPYVVDAVLVSNNQGVVRDGEATADVVKQILSRLDT